MGKHVATEVVKCMMRKDLKVLESNVLMLGITFKENCPDIRNTRAIDIYHELRSYDMNVDVFDPWADPEEVKDEYGLELTNGSDLPKLENYSAIILAVAHERFRNMPIQKSDECVVFDVKSFLAKEKVDKRL
jgi:UDP-N-acetyl-D-galactosamine dehydrogenase